MSRPPTFTPPPGVDARRLRTVRGDFAALDARPAGEARGTVLLLPGFTGSKEDFIALLRPIADAGYRAVAVDGRGQYESQGPEKDEVPYAQAELAQDVLSQAAALTRADGPSPADSLTRADGLSEAEGIPEAPRPSEAASPSETAGPPQGDSARTAPPHLRRLHLLGHSLGGQIARAATLRAPADTFASLTLMASGPAAISPPQQARAKMLTDALAVMSMAEAWAAIQAFDPPEDTDVDGDGDSDALRERWLRHSPAQLIATGKQLCVEPDRVTELAALPLPKHVISGERDDTWPVPWLDEMTRRLAAHRTIIDGAEHSPNTDRPAETAAALIAFWDRAGEQAGSTDR
ncbi:alpha/beta hydrolase [Streptomyces sp. NPDC059900]|uniref:alpha/beta fold hydrolase n=1 Tax=Streptomyces sp. NPDC059900 TaxID=3155816 RepID=UPI003440E035